MDPGHGGIIETKVGDIVTATTFPDFVFRAKEVLSTDPNGGRCRFPAGRAVMP